MAICKPRVRETTLDEVVDPSKALAAAAVGGAVLRHQSAAALYHTQGGLKVNAKGQVLRTDGSIIPNLYAGGGVVVGVSGKGLEGYLPGNGLLPSLGLGMLAAEHAVASLNGN
jgi:fumarate reductase flavoprotein subunit